LSSEFEAGKAQLILDVLSSLTNARTAPLLFAALAENARWVLDFQHLRVIFKGNFGSGWSWRSCGTIKEPLIEPDPAPGGHYDATLMKLEAPYLSRSTSPPTGLECHACGKEAAILTTPLQDPQLGVLGAISIACHYFENYGNEDVISLQVIASHFGLMLQQLNLIDQLREKELALQTKVRELDRLTVNLQRSNKDLEHYAYIASHDLKEPLRTITCYTELLLQRLPDKPSEEIRRYEKLILRGASQMRQLVDDSLRYLQAGRKVDVSQPAKVSRILDSALHTLEDRIAETGAVITRGSLPTLPINGPLIRQVFENILRNAIQYTRHDLKPSIHVDAVLTDSDWVFSVRDQGIGVGSEYFERIFEPFKRLHPHSAYQGNGIGLAIAKRILERHSGRIWIESTLGQETTIFFSLPATREGHADQQ